MNWLGKMIGLPEDFLHRPGGSGGGGVIQTTASEATLVCLLAARTRAIRDVHENDPDCAATEINSRLVAYCSDQVRSRAFDPRVNMQETYLRIYFKRQSENIFVTRFFKREEKSLRRLGIIARK